MTKRLPVAGPYLMPAKEYPFTLAVFRKRDGALVWALSVLAPEHRLLKMLHIPPVASWIGEEVSAVTIKPDNWPQGWKRTL